MNELEKIDASYNGFIWVTDKDNSESNIKRLRLFHYLFNGLVKDECPNDNPNNLYFSKNFGKEIFLLRLNSSDKTNKLIDENLEVLLKKRPKPLKLGIFSSDDSLKKSISSHLVGQYKAQIHFQIF